MISFYPGPSRVFDEIPAWVKQAHQAGILSMNHRSPEFMKLMEETVKLLRKKLQVPADYQVLFTSSATECWEILAQSLVVNHSHHVYNGSFGGKWFDYTLRLRPAAENLVFDPQQELKVSDVVFPSGELICITQNETSNGTQVPVEKIKLIRDSNPAHLVAVDATSSMAGIQLDFTAADVWFASVQKCFGLPAGLAVMINSPRAAKRFLEIGENNHYNSLTYMATMIEKWQTSCTPNVLGIYLLMRSLKLGRPIATTSRQTQKRFHDWVKFFSASGKLWLHIQNHAVRSHTVITVASDPATIKRIKSDARKKDLLLGEGYGPLKESTFRIANFPALKDREIGMLRKFLSAYC